MSKFTEDFYKSIKDEFTSIAANKEGSSEFSGFLDTGSYILNAVCSGSIYGGVPNNKITAFAGGEAVGKTFFVLSICKSFQTQHPKGMIIYYDTEAAVTSEMMQERGLDVSRVIIHEPDTIQKFRTHAIKVLEEYMKLDKKDKPPLIIVLDSLGMLSTTKEMEDSTAGSDTRDMTKAQVIKACFRVLTLKAAKAKVPIILTNHTYSAMSQYQGDVVSGGSGLKYAASTIAMLSKRKEKDGTEVIGNVVHVKMFKSRLSKENAQVDVLITYREGLDRYYGLLELAEKYKIFTKVSTRYQLADGRKVFGKEIRESPEKFFTEEVLKKLDQAAHREFLYGSEQTDNSPEPEVQSTEA